jgi:hypothetical protein
MVVILKKCRKILRRGFLENRDIILMRVIVDKLDRSKNNITKSVAFRPIPPDSA